ncbi:MAG: class I SAM-dependent methyltransferase [Thermincola sp.]|nr:class I SAM-dependent methyltransferase [Thermincola sp.]MDT3704334.1 class I SAM-dependent methyltransferase [Thermincola sp.]
MVSKPESENLFTDFAVDYERMINWPTRLQREAPFFRKVFADANAARVLDAACGTGHHAILFASWGLDVAAIDESEDMINKARQLAADDGRNVDFRTGGFNEAGIFTQEFDVVTCIGNSLPHIKSEADLKQAFLSFHQVLRPGGFLVIQQRNYQRMIAREEKFMPLNTRIEDGKEFLYLRMTELGDDLVTFNIVVLMKDETGNWSYRVESEKLRPWDAHDIETNLTATGFSINGIYGDYGFNSFDFQDSTDVVIVARKSQDHRR